MFITKTDVEHNVPLTVRYDLASCYLVLFPFFAWIGDKNRGKRSGGFG